MTRVMMVPLLLVLACRPSAPAPASTVEVDIDADSEDAGLLYDRALARIGDIDKGLPRVEDGFVWWAQKNDEGTTNHVRRGLAAGDPVEVVLDEHKELTTTESFVDVGVLAASPDGKRVAFSADVTRSDRYGVHVKDMKSGKIESVVDDADFSVAWTKDGNLYFTRFGGDDRPRSLWRLQVDHETTPTLVHQLPDADPGEVLVADVDGRAELFVKEDDAPVAAYRLGGSGNQSEPTSGILRWTRPSVR